MFDAIDPRGKRVVCSEHCWQVHVLRKHPFFLKWLKTLPKTIQEPDAIFRDAVFTDRENYYYLLKNKYIKVVVKFDGDNGEVKTAFLTDSPKPGETLIWSKR